MSQKVEYLAKGWLAMRFVCNMSKDYMSSVSVSAMVLSVR